jgi:DNA adenine methylase
VDKNDLSNRTERGAMGRIHDAVEKDSRIIPALKPFIKWPGGKRWFVEKHAAFLPSRIEGTYIEPFLGGGSVFFALCPKKSHLSDACGDLIATYRAIRTQANQVERLLTGYFHAHCKSFYYYMRDLEPTRQAERAARFIYLNRTCFNGIYRVNRQGKFNVPMGSRNTVIRPEDCFKSWSQSLRASTLIQCDFEESIDKAEVGDFVFADPPYTVQHNFNGFLKYNEVLFCWEDQLRLHSALVRAKKRGVAVLTTNANHESIRTLYARGFKQNVVSRYSSMASFSQYRENFEELVIF